MPGLKKTGVRLAAEGEQGFLSALNKANQAVASVGKSSATTSLGLGAMGAGLASGSIGMAALGAAAATANPVLIALAAAVAVVEVAVKKALEVFKEWIKAFIEFTKHSILLAARWNELGLIAQLWGQRAGLTRQEVDDLTASLEEQGIRTDVANKTIAELARNHLGFAKAVEIAAVAQDAATIAGADSSETLDDIIYAITTLNPLILRHRGLIVDNQTEYKLLAKELGKSESALTAYEKQQAFVNGVIKAGIPIAGAYELVMGNAGKQLRTLIGHELPELSAAFGQFFQPAFLKAVEATRAFILGLTAMFEEGGKLYPLMVKIGAIVDIVADVLKRLSGIALEAGTNFLKNFVNKLAKTAERALRWGVNISVNLADGLIKGAASALIAAMNFISNLIANWLAPGSAPKIAPDLIKWGKAAMEEYLKGWTLADFSFFDKITGFIANYIRSIPSLIGDKAVSIIPRILGTRKAVAEAIASIQRTGDITEAMINKIIKSIGGATRTFRDYIRAYFSAEAATMAVTRAQEELAKASERVKAIQEEINDITGKYDERLKALNKQLGRQGEILDENQRLSKIQTALAGGLLTDEERARLEAEKSDIQTRQQIRLIEDQRDAELAVANTRLMAAQEEQKAVEVRLTQLETQQATAQKYLELQEAIIQTQIDQNNLIKSQMELLKRLAEAAKAGGAGGVGDLGESFAGMEGSFEDAKNRIYAAIEEMKQRIIDKFGEIFAPIREKWDEEWKPIFDDLMKKWNRFELDVLTVWYRLFGPERGIITTAFKTAADKIADIWENTLQPKLQAVQDWMKTDLFPFLKGFAEFIRAVWGYEVKRLSEKWNDLLELSLKPLWAFLSETLGPYIKNNFISGVLDPFRKSIEDILNPLETMLGYLGEVGQKLKDWAAIIRNLPSPKDLVGDSPSPLEAGLIGINKAMRQLSQIELPRLITGMNQVQQASPVSSHTVNYNYSTYSPNIQVDPTYTQVQSQSSIYYDVMAALQATRI